MNSQDALDIILNILSPKNLSYIQKLVFTQSWSGKTYKEIAQEAGYDYDYVKEVGSQLWSWLSEALGERVTKKNLPLILVRHQQQDQSSGITSTLTDAGSFEADSLPAAQAATVQETPTKQPDGRNCQVQFLPDDQFFQDYLQQQWQRVLEERSYLRSMPVSLFSLSLILCGIDQFQGNSTLPDQPSSLACVQQVAQTLLGCLRRAGDLITYRRDGEFAILLPQTNAKGALHLANGLRSRVRSLTIPDRNGPLSTAQTSVTLSAGVVTTFPDRTINPNLFIATAEAALQQAREGGDRVIYKPYSQGINF